MATEVSISNSALLKIGEAPISSLDEDVHQARLCRLRFASCRDKVYAEYPWKFLLKDVALPQVTTPAGTRFEYAFALPTDMITPQEVLDSSSNNVLEYNISGRTLLTDKSFIYLRYVHRATDLTYLPEYISEVIAFALASDLSYSLTQNAGNRAELRRDYELVLRKAKNLDYQGSAPVYFKATTWIDVRG